VRIIEVIVMSSITLAALGGCASATYQKAECPFGTLPAYYSGTGQDDGSEAADVTPATSGGKGFIAHNGPGEAKLVCKPLCDSSQDVLARRTRDGEEVIECRSKPPAAPKSEATAKSDDKGQSPAAPKSAATTERDNNKSEATAGQVKDKNEARSEGEKHEYSFKRSYSLEADVRCMNAMLKCDATCKLKGTAPALKDIVVGTLVFFSCDRENCDPAKLCTPH